MPKFLFCIWIVLLGLGCNLYCQDTAFRPTHVKQPLFFFKTMPLRDMKTIIPAPDTIAGLENSGVIPNLSRGSAAPPAGKFSEPGVQRLMASKKPQSILVNVEGVGNLQNKLPPDTEGDIGSEYYLQMINMSLAVFNKTGDLVYGPVSNLTIWQNAPGPWSGNSNGDPIVLFDEKADRWFISELSFPNYPYGPYYEKIAVSVTSDPTGPWFLYGYDYDYFCDYPKIGIWNDGYYMTANNNFYINSQWDFHAVGVSVFERDSMLAGSPNARKIFFDFYPNTEPWSVLPADFDGNPPPDGTPTYLSYYKEGSPDKIMIYKVQTDWAHPAGSTMTLAKTLIPAGFSGDLPLGIPQPLGAPYLSPMSNRLLYRLQYRNFDDYQTMVTNHTINAGNGVAGIRWYEFRDAGTGWQIFQQGTWSPDDTCRWMGSCAMDGYGNIALGYSVSGTATYPSIRFTGRFKEDPPGLMTVAEQNVIAGSGVQLNSNHRWGDYSSMSVDPLNRTTFWYTQQYYQVTGNRSWQTRIAAFNLNDILTMQIMVENDSICLGDSVRLFAQPAGGRLPYVFAWTSDPPGFISSLQNPVFYPDTLTRFICRLTDGVNTVSDSIVVVVNVHSSAFAGPDTLINAGSSVFLSQAVAENFSSVRWATSGNGSFSDSTLVNCSYTPGGFDINQGSVILSLTAFPLALCDTISDAMLLTIAPYIGMEEGKAPYVQFQAGLSGGTLDIILGNFWQEEVKVSLRELSGRMCWQETVNPGNRQILTVQLHSLKPGMYIAEIRSQHQNFVRKAVVF